MPFHTKSYQIIRGDSGQGEGRFRPVLLVVHNAVQKQYVVKILIFKEQNKIILKMKKKS